MQAIEVFDDVAVYRLESINMAHGSRSSATVSPLAGKAATANDGTPKIADDEEAAIQKMIAAFDAAHESAQDVIAAADRNLTLMQSCTRELQTTVNIVRWSNEYATGLNPETEPDKSC